MKLKRLVSRIGSYALLAILAWALLPHDAHAYLDPGTGSYIFQVLVAALLGAFFMLRLFWARITGVFRKPSSRWQEAGSTSSQDRKTWLPTSESMEPPEPSPGQPPLSEQDDK